MSGHDYIARLRDRNPQLFKNDEATLKITVAEFSRQLRNAFEEGRSRGIIEAKNLRPSLFESIFGSGPP